MKGFVDLARVRSKQNLDTPLLVVGTQKSTDEGDSERRLSVHHAIMEMIEMVLKLADKYLCNLQCLANHNEWLPTIHE